MPPSPTPKTNSTPSKSSKDSPPKSNIQDQPRPSVAPIHRSEGGTSNISNHDHTKFLYTLIVLMAIVITGLILHILFGNQLAPNSPQPNTSSEPRQITSPTPESSDQLSQYLNNTNTWQQQTAGAYNFNLPLGFVVLQNPRDTDPSIFLIFQDQTTADEFQECLSTAKSQLEDYQQGNLTPNDLVDWEGACDINRVAMYMLITEPDETAYDQAQSNLTNSNAESESFSDEQTRSWLIYQSGGRLTAEDIAFLNQNNQRLQITIGYHDTLIDLDPASEIVIRNFSKQILSTFQFLDTPDSSPTTPSTDISSIPPLPANPTDWTQQQGYFNYAAYNPEDFQRYALSGTYYTYHNAQDLSSSQLSQLVDNFTQPLLENNWDSQINSQLGRIKPLSTAGPIGSTDGYLAINANDQVRLVITEWTYNCFQEPCQKSLSIFVSDITNLQEIFNQTPATTTQACQSGETPGYCSTGTCCCPRAGFCN